MLALMNFLSADVQEIAKFLFSLGSLGVTVYFWFIRANRERVSLKVYPVSGFEGCLQPDGVGQWSGRLYLANCSILPTAVVAVKSELFWNDRWIAGGIGTGEGSELPWNLPPSQVYARSIIAAFDLGPETTREQVYADQRLRFTFVTVEGCRVTAEVKSNIDVAAAA